MPRHYLRHFCEAGDEQIGVARLEPFKIIGRGAISRQCQESYFYRGSEGVDDFLSLMESDLAGVLRRVSEAKSMTTEELVALRLLAVVYNMRTRKAARIAKLGPQKMAYEIIRDGIERGELPEPDGGWSPEMMEIDGSTGFLLANACIECWLETQTLDHKLLTPGGAGTFLTSDHPVVLLNQFLDTKESIRSFAGFSRSGFQMMFPIAPDCCLFFFDPRVYKVGGKRDRLVTIGDRDLEIVNSLQVVSAEHCVYFEPNASHAAIETLAREFSSLRQPIADHLRVHATGDSEPALQHINSTVKLPAAWDFCRKKRHPTTDADSRRNSSWSLLCQKMGDDFSKGGEDDFETRFERVLASFPE